MIPLLSCEQIRDGYRNSNIDIISVKEQYIFGCLI